MDMADLGPDRALELFDELNSDCVSDRRIMVYLLEDFFGSVLVEVGSEHLEFRPSVLGRSIRSQWDLAISRIEHLEDSDYPDQLMI